MTYSHPRIARLVLAISLGTVFFLSRTGQAVQVVFTLDAGQSQLGLAADYVGIPLTEQGPGGLLTSYSGTMTVDVDDPAAPTSIEFLFATATAANSGSWLPSRGGGVAAGDPGVAEPANYGAQADFGALGIAYAALRDVVLSISDPASPITGGMFPSDQTVTAVGGWFEYNVPDVLGGDIGSDPFDGDEMNVSSTQGTYQVVGTTATLTVPLFWQTFGDVTTTYSGQFVATASLSTGPDCDFNSDNLCNITDLDDLVMEVSSNGSNLLYDINNDNAINYQDVSTWLSVAGEENLGPGHAYKVGDANLDANVDGSDFGVWNGNKFTNTGKWSKGDFTANGTTDGSDFNAWNSNKFTSADSTAAVPEPSAWFILTSIAACLARRRSRP